MKKLILLIMFAVLGTVSANAQGLKFGIKGGANFSNFSGDLDSENITSWHVGAIAEISILPIFAIQPEVLYSSQGAKVTGSDDIKFDYVNVPVMAKYYILPDILSLEAGPQFGFLVNDNVESTFKTKSFDFAVAGGVGVNVTKSFFAQARYVVGLTDTTADASVKNMTAQLSVGYKF